MRGEREGSELSWLATFSFLSFCATLGAVSLVTNLPGKSETMHITGIIDRYLEHARIFQFCAAGEDKMFIGSADWMPRNLVNRIEVMAPVYDDDMRRDLLRTVDLGLLASGMYVAMVTTVGGLIVGIPAYFGYNYLVARIEKLVFQMEANSIAFMDILNQPVQK